MICEQLQQENDSLRRQLAEAQKQLGDERFVRAVDLLSRANQRWQALLDALPVGVSYSDDPTCQRITGNPAVLSQFEVGADENLSASAVDAAAPGRQVCFFHDGRPITADELPLQKAVAENREIPPLELAVHLPSGRRWVASASGAPIRDEAGKVIGGVAVTADITAAKEAEEQLRRSTAEAQAANAELRQSRRAAINLMDDALAAQAQAQEIAEQLRESEARARLLAEVSAQLLASDRPQQIIEALCRRVMVHLDCHAFFNFLVDDKAGNLRLNAWAGIPEDAARQIRSLEYGVAVCGCVARDGQRIVAENIQSVPDVRTELVRGFGVQAYACHPLLNQGRVVGTLSFGSRSKTTFAKDELALMQTVANHVAIAMQRIHLMESLREHAQAAEAANHAKTQFLANMSHELRTPMNAILGMIDLALPKAVNPIVHDCLETAKGSADLLLALLNDLLDSAKIESGRLELEAVPFNLSWMLEQLTRVLAVQASEKGLAFYSRITEGTPDAFVGDRMRLQQVLLNLAGNAIKFTEAGEVEISVRVAEEGMRDEGLGIRSDESGIESNLPLSACSVAIPTLQSPIPKPQSPPVTPEFSVRDTGIGISREDQQLLFRPFAQADASVTRRFGGTGLGLSICKSLVDLMGGRMWMKSDVDAGSTFCFSVPLPLAVEPPAAAATLPAPPLPVPVALRILVVEDNPANQKLIHYVLRDRGHQVEFAGEGEEAVYLAAENRYDAILMDVQMPGMDGLQATAAIRRQEAEAGRRVPIIAMTAHAMQGDRDRCLAAGMDGYLSKPVHFQRLIDLVEGLACATAPTAQEPPHAPAAVSANHQQAVKPVFNRVLALTRCFDSEEMVREMVQCFFRDLDELFPQIRAALAKGNLEELGRLGHRFKGTLVNLGAEAAGNAATRVERFGISSDGPPAAAAAAVDALECECLALKAVLEQSAPAAAVNEG